MIVANNTRQMRIVNVRGAIYIRLEDVALYIRDLGSTEETDVRNRLDQASREVEKLGAVIK